MAREAMFYQEGSHGTVRCLLCPHTCVITEGRTGFCRVRENINGTLRSLVYSRPCSASVGYIEKAPLYHFVPGHRRLCMASAGCNLRCRQCQNWYLSQVKPEEIPCQVLAPEDAVKKAFSQGVDSISFTFSEPTIFYEYVYDTCKLAREKGLLTSIVSNGYINPAPLKKLLPHLSAVKIDLKGFTAEFYRDICEGDLEAVLATLKLLKEEGAYFEIVNLVIPTLNDDPGDIRAMCRWISDHLSGETPIHFTRFHPDFRLQHLPATPVATLETAIGIAREEGLTYIYIGNVPGHKNNHTCCPGCGDTLIRRNLMMVLENQVDNGCCRHCSQTIPGVWD